MAELSKAIEETAQQADRHLTRRRVEELLRLPATVSLQTKLAEWKPDRYASTSRNEMMRSHLERNVRDGEERDRIIASRPEGCWCLGTGKHKPLTRVVKDDSGNEAEVCAGGRVYCSCQDGQDAKAEWDAEQAQDRSNRITAHWDEAEIPARFSSFTLDESPALKANPGLRKKLIPDDTSWFFYGTYGVGKTGLAVGYAREYLASRNGSATILFRSLPKLLAELRGTYANTKGEQSEQDVLTRYQNVSLLVLDDLGAEQMTEKGQTWLQDRLYQIIGERHDELKPMVFTSNLNMAQLNTRLGERLTWRILEMCGKDHIIEVKGANLRA